MQCFTEAWDAGFLPLTVECVIIIIKKLLVKLLPVKQTRQKFIILAVCGVVTLALGRLQRKPEKKVSLIHTVKL